MIKWVGYGKLLKQGFFTLLISCFIFLGGFFVSAQSYTSIHTEKMGVLTGSQGGVKYQVSGGGTLLSQYLGISRRVLALEVGSPKVYFFRGVNHIPYSYYYYSSDNVRMQGYFDYYQICNELTGGTSDVSNCVNYKINSGTYTESLTPFFKSLTSSDYYGYSYGYYTVYFRTYYLRVCFSSSEYHNSVCFMTVDGLNNSLGLDDDISFGDINQLLIGNPPGFVYDGVSEGNIEGNIDSAITGDYVFTECTVGGAKSYAENVLGLNPYVCYGGRDIDYTGVSVLNPGQGSSVFDIYNSSSDGKNFSDWFVYRKGIYDNRYVYNQSFWSGKEYIYDYFTLLNQYGLGLSARQVQDYCRIIVNNMSLTGKRTGVAGRCPSPIDGLPGGSGGGGGGGGGSWSDVSNGEVPIGVNRGSGQENKDTKTFIQDFFNKAKSNIPTDFTDIGGGFLPTYIITFLLAIILFKFLKH